MALPISTNALVPLIAALGPATLIALTAIAPQREYSPDAEPEDSQDGHAAEPASG
ncbi:hypothetical protein [Nocardia sp. NPDC051570]|uniref:hypothetical protein n=1 Tax=Nocardia sp. NPDC051570 TaxID=3364324 RepID=UPI00379F5CE6